MGTDPLEPGVITWVRAAWRGEQSAVALEAMRRAGKAAYGELLRADQLREEILGTGSLWQPAPALASQLLAGWNAFVLQTLSEAFLDVDYRTSRGTVGYVPPTTYTQVWTWLSAAQGWLNRIEQAGRNPDYDLAAELALPAALPDWVEVSPCPPAYVDALAAAAPAIRANTESALLALRRHPAPAARERALNRLFQVAADAAASADYALALRGESGDQRLYELIGQNLKHAIEIWFELGQVAAIPALLDHYRSPLAGPRPDPARLPGGTRFDPWCLTDPRTRELWQADPEACQAVQALWAADPDPGATLALAAEIDAALTRGDLVRIRTDDGGFCYYVCPWASLYEVRRPVRIAGKNLKLLRQFTLDLSAGGVTRDEPFRRELIFGPFEQTDDVGYQDPDGDPGTDAPRRRRPPHQRRHR